MKTTDTAPRITRQVLEALGFMLGTTTGTPLPWPVEPADAPTPPGTAAQPPDVLAGHPRRGAGHSHRNA